MKKEDLLRALGDVGEDLLHMAEHKRFYHQWKKWASLAACLALVVGLGLWSLPHLGTSVKESEAPAEAPMMDCVVEESAIEDYEFKTEEAPVEEEAPAELETQAEGTCICIELYTAQDVQDAFDRGDHQWILETFVAPHEDIEGLSVKEISVEENIVRLWIVGADHGEKQYQIRFHETGWEYVEISTPG